MTSWRVMGAAAVGLAALIFGAGMRVPATAQGEAAWLTDWESAKAASRQTGKPILVAFR